MEESTDAAGHHTTKKVTEGNGWKQVEIQSDGPMDMGSLIAQMMQEQMKAMDAMRQGMMQRESSGPFFTLPPPQFSSMFDDDLHEEHEAEEEDPFAVIEELDKNKRQPGFFGSSGGDNQEPFVDPITDDHALVPLDESPAADLAA